MGFTSAARSVAAVRGVAIATLLVVTACGRIAPAPAPAEPAGDSGESLTFEGTWTASGTRHTLELEPGHRAAVFDLTGSLLLTGPHRPAAGFRARAMGFTDSATGMIGRCVWTDERGDQVFCELKGQAVASGNHIVGTFTGGTGRYAGVTGEYEFEWQYVIEADDGAVSGRVVGLKGRAHLAATSGEPAR